MNSALEHYKRAVVYWENKQYEPAIVELKQSLEKDPNYRDAVFNLGCLYALVDRYEEALKEFHVLIHINPSDSEAYKYIGKLFLQKAKISRSREDLDSAKEAYQKSLVLNPDDAITQDDLSIVLFELGEFVDALEMSKAATALAPKNRRISYNLDVMYARIMRKHLSKGEWRAAWHLWKTGCEYYKGRKDQISKPAKTK